MRIIVVGAGKVGTALCRSLVEEKHDVILIEEKEAPRRAAACARCRSNASANVMMLWALLEMGLILKFWNKPRLTTAMSLSR